MSLRAEVWLWLAQRASAAVLAICVIVHLATLVFAVQGGLTAAEIGARLEGSGAWLAFYLLFVLAAAVHAPIGLRNVLGEWTPIGASANAWLSALLALALLALGARAAFAVYAGAP